MNKQVLRILEMYICNFYSKNNFKILTCWLRQHFSFLSKNSQNYVVPRGRLGVALVPKPFVLKASSLGTLALAVG